MSFSAPSVRTLFRSTLLAAALCAVPWTSLAQSSLAKNHIYPEIAAANHDVSTALQQAKQQHKRILLDFGGDWCPDCQVLDINFHKPVNLDLLQHNFILVHVNIGRQDANTGLAEKYGIDVEKGVPALAVLDPAGKVLYAKPVSDFRSARNMDPQTVTDFLNQWKS